MEVVLHFSSLLLLHFIVLATSLNDEGLALLSFKQALDNTSFGYLENWNSYDTTPCSWDGVQCREGKVSSIILPGKGLHGALYLDGGKLPAIQLVDLRNNHFSGSIPVELLNATGLKSLVLAANSFSGQVPWDIGNLMYLQSLDLSTNYFNGSFPSSLVHCKRLKKLVLSGNSFTGSLPDRFGTNLSMLQMLNLSYNNFSGLIPADIGKLSNLQGVFDLSHNLFSGPIPESLGDLPESIYINLAHNNLSGVIPQNGAMANAGPTAFLENPLLCGPPLKIPCPLYPKPIAGKPSKTSGGNNRKGNHWSPWIIVVTASGTVTIMCLLCLSFSYRFRKSHPNRKQKNVEGCTLEQRTSVRKERFCFRTDDLESLTENIDQYTFIPVDQHVSFNLEQLLKASAFLLGKSIRGIVYKVVLEKGPTVAVRRLENAGSPRFRKFQTAVETIGKIRHPNIVCLLAYCWCTNEKLLVYEYVPNGDLATALHGGKTGTTHLKPLPWAARLRIIKGVAKGMACLHEFSQRKFVHGNLKPSNILLGDNMEPHISDTGLSRLAHTVEEFQAGQSEQSLRGTPQQASPYSSTPGTSSMSGSCYEAPEASKTAKPSQKCDVYSYGVILLELISGKSPGTQIGASEMNLARWIQLGIEVKELADIIDPFLSHDLVQDQILAAVKIALACVHANPDKRPSMRNVSDNLDRLTRST